MYTAFFNPGSLRCSRLIHDELGNTVKIDELIYHLKLTEDGQGQMEKTDKALKPVFILAVGNHGRAYF